MSFSGFLVSFGQLWPFESIAFGCASAEKKMNNEWIS